jgi:D-sedoheptulose 7-phosphate isomerase
MTLALDNFKSQIQDSISTKKLILEDLIFLNSLLQLSNVITKCLMNGGHIYFAGNGGSAADAQHFAAEFVSRFNFDRPGLSASSLSTDTSIITAIGNDYGFNSIFSRQLQAKAKSDDIFIGITTSGNSKNILEAFSLCKSRNIFTAAFCSNKNPLDNIVNISLNIPNSSTARIQEGHLLIGHLLCSQVEANLFGE